jgi:hypothetical protein
MASFQPYGASQEWGNLAARLPDIRRQVSAFLSGLTFKSLILVALWALYVLWTGWGAVTNGGSALFGARPTSLFQVSAAPALFFLNLWGCAAGLVFGIAFSNPFAWLNGKRLIFGSIAVATCNHPVVGSQSSAVRAHADCN